MKCESMVYLNQIFTNLETPSCPLPGELTASSDTFTQQLTFYEPTNDIGCECGHGCNFGCSCMSGGIEFDDDLTFVVENTQVFVTNFTLADPEGLTAANVTVNGIPVDSLTVTGNRFTAATDALMPQIENCACLEKSQSTKAMLLIQGAGPWVAKLTIVAFGSVFGCGACKKFKLVMTTREDVSIDIPGTSTFAVSQLCLPCTKGGAAPVIQFSFLAEATLLNPVIVTDTGSGPCNIILTGALITEPAAAIQVTRETLFTIDADTVPQPCDNLAKCVQAPGTCTCTEDFLLPPNPCCDDGCRNDDTDTSNDRNGTGCGCGCNTCGTDIQQYKAATAEPRGAVTRHQADICCQFNGINGCSL